MVRIVDAELFDVAEKRCNCKGIKTRIDFLYVL
jgi:hypothetical protein